MWRSRRLAGPSKGMPLRPTPDALRERAFAVLGSRVVGADVLDLYAGTGAVGLEALSRGARRAVFVERHRAAAGIIRRNIDQLEPTGTMTRLVCRPARAAVADLGRRRQSFGLVWADPPFDRWEEGLETLIFACNTGILAENGVVCLECPAEADLGAFQMPMVLSRDLGGGASRLLIMELPPRHLDSRANAGGENPP
jgi:16S rRNA (guanine966-N2)-methyltransferase